MNPAICSILAWPKGWSLSAGLLDNLNPINVITELPASVRLATDWMIIEILDDISPTAIPHPKINRLNIIPITPATTPYL